MEGQRSMEAGSRVVWTLRLIVDSGEDRKLYSKSIAILYRTRVEIEALTICGVRCSRPPNSIISFQLTPNSEIGAQRLYSILPPLVLSQKLLPIIIAIWGSNQSVNVKGKRLLIVEKDARMMIKLNHNDWRMHFVVKGISVSKSANPAESRVIPVASNLFQVGGQCVLWEVVQT